MFRGTGIFNGSRFVHHGKRYSAFIVVKQQLKAYFHQYLVLIVHLLPKVSIIGSMLEKDFKAMKKVRYIEKLSTNIMPLINNLQ